MGVEVGIRGSLAQWAPMRRGGRISFTVDDPELDAPPVGMGLLKFGDDPHGPVVVFFDLEPNLEFATHYHDTDQCFVVLEGSVRIGRTWYEAGSVRVQEAGSVYGPGLVGPKGCKAIAFYGDRSELPDKFANERDRERCVELMARYGAKLGPGVEVAAP